MSIIVSFFLVRKIFDLGVVSVVLKNASTIIDSNNFYVDLTYLSIAINPIWCVVVENPESNIFLPVYSRIGI